MCKEAEDLLKETWLVGHAPTHHAGPPGTCPQGPLRAQKASVAQEEVLRRISSSLWRLWSLTHHSLFHTQLPGAWRQPGIVSGLRLGREARKRTLGGQTHGILGLYGVVRDTVGAQKGASP